MKYIEIQNDLFFPADKIVGVIKDQDDEKKLMIWLGGTFVQTISSPSRKERDEHYDYITKILKEL